MTMPMKPIVFLALLLAVAVAAVWLLKFAGVTHEDLYEAVTDESKKVQSAVDDRYRQLDKRLDRIESKLDKLLELANRPLPDGLQRAD